MRKAVLILGTCAVLAAATEAAEPQVKARGKAPARAGDPAAGQVKAEAERCIECHGAEGQGDGQDNGSEARFAKLAGQHAEYLVKQLQNYRGGVRKHDVMRLNTQRLEEADMRDIAAYFATRAPMRGEGSGEHAAARALFTQGDAARSIVACASCHGEGGKGTKAAGPLVPILAGQDARYLEQQLLDWRSAWRTESAGGVMNRVTRALSDAEIRSLAQYLASQR